MPGKYYPAITLPRSYYVGQPTCEKMSLIFDLGLAVPVDRKPATSGKQTN
jgi:hypothetical protein